MRISFTPIDYVPMEDCASYPDMHRAVLDIPFENGDEEEYDNPSICDDDEED